MPRKSKDSSDETRNYNPYKRKSDSADQSDDSDYRKKRDRNNQAVKRSRVKSKIRTQQTLERVQQLKIENEMLEEKIKMLTKELGFLKDLFLAHAGTSDNTGLENIDLELLLKDEPLHETSIALGFLLTPLIVKYSNNMDDIGADLSKLYYGVAGMTGISLLLVLLFFREQPPVPPSDTQAARHTSSETTNFTKSLKNLLTNKGFLLLCLSYGINVGIFFALSTLLNQIILEFFPDGEEFAGQIGLLIIMSGIVGSAVSGFILDKTHKFKETSLAVYAMSLLGMVVFSLTIHFASKVIVFITAGLLGFFMTGYLPVGFEFGAELTYPESETTSAAILCSFAQVFGIVFTVTYGWLFERTGDKWANVFLCISLVIGTVVTAMIKSDLRRQYARCNSASTEEKK